MFVEYGSDPRMSQETEFNNEEEWEKDIHEREDELSTLRQQADAAAGEVSIEVKRPWLCQRNAEEFSHAEIAEKTGWKPRIRKSTTKPSNTIKAINYQLKISSSDRVKHLKQVCQY